MFGTVRQHVSSHHLKVLAHGGFQFERKIHSHEGTWKERTPVGNLVTLIALNESTIKEEPTDPTRGPSQRSRVWAGAVGTDRESRSLRWRIALRTSPTRRLSQRWLSRGLRPMQRQ